MTTPVPTRRLSPEEVLAGLRDICRRPTPADPTGELAAAGIRPDTRVDLVFADRDEVEAYFGIEESPPDAWWARVYQYGTVWGLCHALATVVEVPAPPPARYPGLPPDEGGLFVYVRGQLEDRLPANGELTPDTDLTPYLWTAPEVFQWQLPRLAPGRLPPLRVTNRRLGKRLLHAAVGLGVALAAGVGMKFAPFAAGVLAGVGVKMLVVNLLLAFWAARRGNWAVEFGGLTDFRELVRTMLGKPTPTAPAAE